jgi:CPA1 family monovalent cation:H+ antiporter
MRCRTARASTSTGSGSLALIAATVPLVLLSRLVAVALPVGLLRFTGGYRRGTIAMLVWGGLKEGISIALALSLPQMPGRELLLAAAYAVVVFSVLVQGLTLGPLASRIVKAPA